MNENKSLDVIKGAPTAINLPILVDSEYVLEVMRENLEGMGEMRFTKISVPSGGGLSFSIIDESGKETPVTEIKGVIIHKAPVKRWYARDFEERGEGESGAPDCYSSDAIHGCGSDKYNIPAGQLCESCPKNTWGSSRKGGRGKDCQDRVILHLLQDGETLPVKLELPPTCIGPFKEYIKRITSKGIPLSGVVTIISLETERNDNNVKYSKTVFTRGPALERKQYASVRNYAKMLEPGIEASIKMAAAEPHVAEPAADDEDEQQSF